MIIIDQAVRRNSLINKPKSISGSSSQMLNLVRIWSSGQVRTPEMFHMNNHRNNVEITETIQINGMQYGKILNRPKITQIMHHRFLRSGSVRTMNKFSVVSSCQYMNLPKER